MSTSMYYQVLVFIGTSLSVRQSAAIQTNIFSDEKTIVQTTILLVAYASTFEYLPLFAGIVFCIY